MYAWLYEWGSDPHTTMFEQGFCARICLTRVQMRNKSGKATILCTAHPPVISPLPIHRPSFIHRSSKVLSKPTYCKREYLYSCNVVTYIEDISVITYAWKQISLGFHMHENNKILLNYIGITRVNIYKLSWWKSISVITYASNANNYLCMKNLYEKYYMNSYVLTYVWIK